MVVTFILYIFVGNNNNNNIMKATHKYLVEFIDGNGDYSEAMQFHTSPYHNDMADWFSCTFGLQVTNIIKK